MQITKFYVFFTATLILIGCHDTESDSTATGLNGMDGGCDSRSSDCNLNESGVPQETGTTGVETTHGPDGEMEDTGTFTTLPASDTGIDDTFQSLSCTQEGALPSGFSLGSAETYASLSYLSCIAWRLSADGKLNVDCINVAGECRDDLLGSVSQNGNEVTLSVSKRPVRTGECDTTGCTCPNNYSFEVMLSSVPETMTLVLQRANCDGEKEEELARLALGAEDVSQGIACRPSGFLPTVERECGALHGPCMGGEGCETDGATTPQCVGDLVCGTLSDSLSPLCLAPCVDDSDCPNTQAFFCDNGVCQIKASF